MAANKKRKAANDTDDKGGPSKKCQKKASSEDVLSQWPDFVANDFLATDTKADHCYDEERQDLDGDIAGILW